MNDGSSGSRDDRLNLICDIVDNVYGTVELLYAATSLISIQGNNTTTGRFLFSDIDLSPAFMRKIDSMFVKPHAKELATVLDTNANISVTTTVRDAKSVPAFTGRNTFFFVPDSPRSNSIDFIFNQKTDKRPARFILTDEISRKSFVPRHPRGTAFSPVGYEESLSCVDGMSRLFAIYWMDSVGQVWLSSPDKDLTHSWTQRQEFDAENVARKAIFGIRDFLHSKQTNQCFAVRSYRSEVDAIARACLTAPNSGAADGRTYSFRVDHEKLREALEKPGVTSAFAATRSWYPDGFGSGATIPQFIRSIHTQISTTVSSANIAFLSRGDLLSPPELPSIWHVQTTDLQKMFGKEWKTAVTLIQLFDHLSLEQLQGENNNARIVRRGAEMYYEFFSSIRNLCTMELLSAAV